jgi:hypothetical protein
MARVKVATLLVPLLLTMAGCSALFDFNAFKALDVPPAPKASDYQGPAGLTKLAEDLSSAAVVDQFIANPATTAQIELDLLAYISAPLTSLDQKQKAEVLYADLNLKTTSGDDLVNNVVSALLSPSAWNGDIKTIIGGIIPTDVQGSQAAFVAMVNGLLDANTAYDLLGNSLTPPSVPDGMNTGDVAQKAAVAYLMKVVVDEVVAQSSGSLNQAQAIDQIFLLVNNEPNSIDAYTIPSDPLSSPTQALQNIFDVAGLQLTLG